MPEGPVVNTNLGPAPISSANPIASAGGVVDVMNNLAEMRNRQNANILFQQQMSARHQLGEDLAVWAAQGLTPEQQIERASHQSYAPFVTPEIANFRTSNLAGVQVQEAQKRITETQAKIEETYQRMQLAGLEPMAKALVATGGDPKLFDAAFKSVTAGYSPEQMKSAKAAFAGMKDFLTKGLPEDPAAAKQEVIERTRRLGIPFGISLDSLYAATGAVRPTVATLKSPTGEESQAVVSGGGQEPIKSNILSTGPGTAAQERMKIEGQQQAGLAPTPFTWEDASGAKHYSVLTGGGMGAPALLSPAMDMSGKGGGLLEGGGPAPAAAPAAGAASAPAPSSAPAEPAPRPVPTAAVGPSIAAEEYLKRSAEEGVDIEKETNENSKTLPQMAKRVEVLANAMEKFQSGGFAPTRAGAASMVQGLRNMGFNIPEEAIDLIGNGSLKDQQVFRSLISRAAVQSLKADAEGTGRVMRSEVDRYLDAIGDGNDPGAVRVLLNNLRFNMLVGYDQAQKFVDFRNMLQEKNPALGRYKQLSDFPKWYASQFEEKNLELPKGMKLGEIPEGTFKGEVPKGLGVGESREAEPGVTIRRVK